jgi:hypothetical protein
MSPLGCPQVVRPIFVLGPLLLCLGAPLAALGTTGCGKTHRDGHIRSDPRRPQAQLPRRKAWDEPIPANGFYPVPVVTSHPP